MAGAIVEDADWAFYLSVRDSLLASSRGLYALIRDRQVVGVFSTALEAFEEGKRRFGVGGSLILHIGQERWPPRGPRPVRFGRSSRGALVDNPIREVDIPPPV